MVGTAILTVRRISMFPSLPPGMYAVKATFPDSKSTVKKIAVTR
jgi:hypothetical protein